MEKKCIFCGLNPESKNKEHVLPQWLLKMTGDPNRNVNFGMKLLSDPLVFYNFAYSSFQFPACVSCNTKYSNFENEIKQVFEKIINSESISEDEIDKLLDWFDKVRVGLWLGYRYLNKNICGIDPKFYINSRIKTRDRFLHIFKINGMNDGLSVIGTSTPIFQFSPSVFALRVNSFVFINGSDLFLLARRMGYPYSQKNICLENDTCISEIVKGRNYILKPILRRNIPYLYSGFYQSIYPTEIQHTGVSKFYDCSYVRENSLNIKSGIGSIFFEQNSIVTKFQEKIIQIPEYAHYSKVYIHNVANFVFDFQVDLFQEQTFYNKFSEGKKEMVKQHLRGMRTTVKELKKRMLEEENRI